MKEILKIQIQKIIFFYKKKFIRDYFCSLKGFKKVKDNTNIIDNIYYKITNISHLKENYSKFFYQDYIDEMKIIINQTLWRELGENKLQKKLLIFFHNKKKVK